MKGKEKIKGQNVPPLFILQFTHNYSFDCHMAKSMYSSLNQRRYKYNERSSLNGSSLVKQCKAQNHAPHAIHDETFKLRNRQTRVSIVISREFSG